MDGLGRHGVPGWILALSILALLTTLSLPSIPKASASSIDVSSDGIAKGVDAAASQPIDPTRNFDANDSAVYSWVELANVPPPAHDLAWIWLTPQRHIYAIANATISDPGKGNYWPNLFYYADINITGNKAAQLPGPWEVEFLVDGVVAALQNFSISNVSPLVEPAGGWFWPSPTIPVYIQPQPSYALEAAVQAMWQWNYSQAWFQSAYGLPARPTFLFTVSNESSSPVTVSFNQTQTGPYTSNDETSIEVDSSGSIVSVRCSISVVLRLSTGLNTNAIFLENALIDQLGNCMGLGRAQVSGDIMNPSAPNKYDSNSPSTLDLYSLYQMSGARNVTGLSASYGLPTSIPYVSSPEYGQQEATYENAPQFPSQWVALGTLACLLAFATILGGPRRRR